MKRFEKNISPLMKKPLFFSLAALLGIAPVLSHAGGVYRKEVLLENFEEVPIGQELPAKIKERKWDLRCSSVQLTPTSAELLNGTIPGKEISTEVFTDTIKQAAQAWNDVQTSYIEVEVVDAYDVREAHGTGLNFVNSVTILPRRGGIFAGVVYTDLPADSLFEVGEDIDGDGDSDVFDPTTTEIQICHDIDGDGDIEFPAGLYEAGTILDADITFSGSGVEWTVNVDDVGYDPETNVHTMDVLSIVTHEIGHALGLQHSLINQISETEGGDATMYYEAASTPEYAAGMRSLSEDDKAWISYLYPEGSGVSGVAAVQPNDIPFDSYYGFIEGTVEHNNKPLVGTHVIARSATDSNITVGGIGSNAPVITQVWLNTRTSRLSTTRFDLENATMEASRYRIPVPRHGAPYTLEIEGLDSSPTPNFLFDQLSTATQNDIPQSYYSGNFFERLQANPRFFAKPDFALSVFPDTIDANFVVPLHSRTPNFPRRQDSTLYTDDNLWVVRRFSGADILNRLNNGSFLNGVRAFTAAPRLDNGILADSAVPAYGKAVLATGKRNADGQVELGRKHFVTQSFVGDDRDYSYLEVNPVINAQIQFALRNDPELDVFLAFEPVDSILPSGQTGKSVFGLRFLFDFEEKTSFVAQSLDEPLQDIEFDMLFDLSFIHKPQ